MTGVLLDAGVPVAYGLLGLVAARRVWAYLREDGGIDVFVDMIPTVFALLLWPLLLAGLLLYGLVAWRPARTLRQRRREREVRRTTREVAVMSERRAREDELRWRRVRIAQLERELDIGDDPEDGEDAR